MKPTFIHLRLHSEYSLSDGLVRIEDLVEHAVKQDVPAIAITDQSNLFATIKFYQELNNSGIKPIIGSDVWLENPTDIKKPFRLTLLCQNQQGYQNLRELISSSYIDGQETGTPILKKSWLYDKNAGLIVLSGAREGEIGQLLLAKKMDAAEVILKEWLKIFSDRFYLELQRTGRPQEETYLRAVISLAQKNQVGVVATNDVRFIHQDDFEAHEARVCIHAGYVLSDPKRPREYSEQQYFRSQKEMETLFADIPEALANSVEIAKRCNVELVFGKTFLPNFPIPEGYTAESYLIEQAEKGLEERFNLILSSENADNAEIKKQYYDRLKLELDVINSMGFPGYFLIVADFIRWAKQHGIPVGPGRGSGAGSLVAYAIQIIDIDPIPYDLLFERFLNPERVSMPDFDIDFCMDKRDQVIEYVADRYGRDAVSQIITYGTMAARAVVRDVGRVLAYSYGMVDKIAKLIPFELGITLDKALEQEEELKRRYDEEDEVRVLFDLALKLEGLARNAGKHAAGVVMAPSQLTDFTALYCEPGSNIRVTQFDLNDIQTVGLVKFDFLGLRTLTIIDWAIQAINKKRLKQGEGPLDILRIPINDPDTFQLLKDCATTAVFQLESRGMKDLVKRMQPDCFEDIIALVALFRPGPLQSGMTEDFVNRKHGRSPIEYLHPALESILRSTYGIIVYQEQVMQIARELAGYTLGSADLLRRAMGKKKAEEMAEQRAIFTNGAKERGIQADVAKRIFDLMEMFADYGFNKSHSAAYALVTYQTAWLKAHYPAEFMASVLSSDMDHTEKVVGLLDECRRIKIPVNPPDINRSETKFFVNEENEIVYGLGAVKGVGEAAIEGILVDRKANGPYKNLIDFCRRIDSRKVNRRTLEALVKSGSLDKLGPNRASLFAGLDQALQMAEQNAESAANGQHDLFGESHSQDTVELTVFPEWKKTEILKGEKEVLGFYLSGHPLERYQEELNKFITAPIAELQPNKNQTVIIAGWVVAIRVLFTKRGDRMGIITLEDASGKLDITVFSEAFNNHKDLIQKDGLLIAEGEVSIDDFTGSNRVTVKRLMDITQAREQFVRSLSLSLLQNQCQPAFIDRIKNAIKPFISGPCPVLIQYERQDAFVEISLGKQWLVSLRDELLDGLIDLVGPKQLNLNYITR